MIVPIWVASWEIECCQPDATVGEIWGAPLLMLMPPEPWWKQYSSAPIAGEVEDLGVVALDGDVAQEATPQLPGVFKCESLLVIVPALSGTEPRRLRGRLSFEGHGGPDLDMDLPCRGIVRRVRGIPLLYELRNGAHVPVSQGDVVDLVSTRVRGFPEYLVDLELIT